MDRRTVIKGLIAATGGLLLPSRRMWKTNYFGWDYNPKSLDDFICRHNKPFITDHNQTIKDTGKGKKAFLHSAYEHVTKQKYIPHKQGTTDCVAHAAGLAVDFLSAMQIALNKPEKWVAKAATEPIYGGSRIEIGGTNIVAGSTGHWAAEWVERYGILHMIKYDGFDFTRYSALRADKYGVEGCPDALEPIAKQHPVQKTAICRSYEDLCDCLHNGHPVIVCSNVGFGSRPCTRDSEGFLRRRRMPWWHAMLFGGYDDEYKRPGALCYNSWGTDWVDGPTRGLQPSGSFWVDADTVDIMLRQGDSFAFSAYKGFPKVDIPDYILY